jgi:hypothetical protein
MAGEHADNALDQGGVCLVQQSVELLAIPAQPQVEDCFYGRRRLKERPNGQRVDRTVFDLRDQRP